MLPRGCCLQANPPTESTRGKWDAWGDGGDAVCHPHPFPESTGGEGSQQPLPYTRGVSWGAQPGFPTAPPVAPGGFSPFCHLEVQTPGSGSSLGLCHLGKEQGEGR